MAVENGKEMTALDKKIARQVEYYFGDVNFPRDKFLQEKAREDDGWISMDVMLKFNRLKSLSEDKELICKALKKSDSGLMEVSDDFTKIRRSPSKPLPDNSKERKDDFSARSVYVKGFPVECTLDTLMEFFEQYGKIDTIFMRRDKQKVFKGSVLVTFNSQEDENKFLGLEDLKYKDSELTKMKKEEYFKMKQEQEKERKKANAGGDKDQKKAEQKKEEEEKMVEEQMTKGAVLFMKGLSKGTSVDTIRTFFSQYGNVAWVEFATGDEKALVRFNEAEAQEAMIKALKEREDGKVVMNDNELELRVLDGEEEKEYWKKMFRDIADRKSYNRKNRSHQNRKRKFGGGRPKGNKDGGDDAKDGADDDETPRKKARQAEDDAE